MFTLQMNCQTCSHKLSHTSLVNECHTFFWLHLTTLDERSKAGRKREPATGSEHLLVGIKITIPVLPSKVSYTSVEARSCVKQ